MIDMKNILSLVVFVSLLKFYQEFGCFSMFLDMRKHVHVEGYDN